MNRKGGIIFGIAVGVMIFIAGMLFINFFFSLITDVRAADVLNCASPSTISDGTKMSCLAIDIIIPVLIVIIISFAGGIIADSLT